MKYKKQTRPELWIHMPDFEGERTTKYTKEECFNILYIFHLDGSAEFYQNSIGCWMNETTMFNRNDLFTLYNAKNRKKNWTFIGELK